MQSGPAWEGHLSLEGTTTRRSDAVPGWVAVYRAQQLAPRRARRSGERAGGWSRSCLNPHPPRDRGRERRTRRALARAGVTESCNPNREELGSEAFGSRRRSDVLRRPRGSRCGPRSVSHTRAHPHARSTRAITHVSVFTTLVNEHSGLKDRPICPGFSQFRPGLRPKLARLWPSSTPNWPSSAYFGGILTNTTNQPGSAKHWPGIDQGWPNLTRS